MEGDRKSTRLNSSHPSISYAVFCLRARLPISPLFPYTTLFRSPGLPKEKQVVVNLTAFRSDVGDVQLPIAPFTETPGTFISTEGRVQSFHAAVRPSGEARPGWKEIGRAHV